MQKIKRKIIISILILCILVGQFAFTKNPDTYGAKVSDNNSLDIRLAKRTIFTPNTNLSPSPQINEALYKMALNGYNKLVAEEKIRKPLLTIVDFSKPSSENRLFIIDMVHHKVLLNTLVAHGRNSGEKMATQFSNLDASHQSSLGFYLTGGTYQGGNGYSLKLIGLETGFNDRAESRAIVMHGAPYVNQEVVKNTGRLGRSWGCPAVSQVEHKKIIDLIKGGSCLFIYAPQKAYLTASSLIKDTMQDSGTL